MAFEEFDLNGPLVRSWLEELGKLFPPGRTAVRDAMKTGDLSTKLKDKDFHKTTTDWATKTADPKDQEQRLEMVAVLKAMPPDDPLRTAIFQKAFNTKLESGVRRYEVVIDPRTKKPRVDPRTKVELPPAEKYTKGPLDPAAMNEMADIMAQLPIAHMPKGWNLVGQDVDKNTRGSYNDDVDMAELNFSLLDTKVGFEQEYSAGGGCLPGDPLEKAKAFDLLIRHECGHKAGTKLARELTSLPFAGEWKCPGTTEAVLDEISSVFNDFVTAVQQNGAPKAPAVREAVLENLFNAEGIADALGIDHGRVPGDHLLVQVLEQGAKKTYQCGSSPVSVKGRMYVVGGPEGQWFSFAKAAWDKRVSLYQFATPEEWFAEFYATANNGDAEIRKAAKQKYPDAWNWLKDKRCIVVGG